MTLPRLSEALYDLSPPFPHLLPQGLFFMLQHPDQDLQLLDPRQVCDPLSLKPHQELLNLQRKKREMIPSFELFNAQGGLETPNLACPLSHMLPSHSAPSQ